MLKSTATVQSECTTKHENKGINLANLLTQLVYTRTNSPQKGIPFFPKAWNMPVPFLIYFYQITSK